MKIRDLSDEDRIRLARQGDKEMPTWYKDHPKIVDAFRRGYTKGFLSGYDFYENKHKKARKVRPSPTGE